MARATTPGPTPPHPTQQVVLFTAGLEDYAAPICDAIEARYPGAFHHRLYRPATTPCDAYPCVKDMAHLGRDLRRCVLVDDTPLAFYRQPDHGIPVLQVRRGRGGTRRRGGAGERRATGLPEAAMRSALTSTALTPSAIPPTHCSSAVTWTTAC